MGCRSEAVTERSDLTEQRTDGVPNRASLPSDIIAFVVFCRLRHRLTLRDLSEIGAACPGHEAQPEAHLVDLFQPALE